VVYIVRTGQTIWEQQGRMESIAGVPLSQEGRRAVQAVARELADRDLSMIYTAPGEAEGQTAEVLAGELGLKVRKDGQLHELDFGLWQGLTAQELKRRQPKLFKQWTEDPSSIRPPGGEAPHEAQHRLLTTVRSILKRRKNGPAVLILRPLAAALLRCALDGGQVESLWSYVESQPPWCKYEVDPDFLKQVVKAACEKDS